MKTRQIELLKKVLEERKQAVDIKGKSPVLTSIQRTIVDTRSSTYSEVIMLINQLQGKI